MGICESKNNQESPDPKVVQNKIANPSHENNRYLNNNENKIITTEKKYNIIEQNVIRGNVAPFTIWNEERINLQMKKSICKINIGGKYGTGFFCLIPIDEESFYYLRVLITNKSFVNEEQLLKIKKVDITLDNDREERTIYITSERIIYSSKEYDVTFIELFPGEYGDKGDFLQIDNEFTVAKLQETNGNKNGNNVYIIQYINEANCIKSFGIINNINGNIINHNCTGKPGGPILSLNNGHLIGLNMENGKGIMLKGAINDFSSFISNKKENKNKIKNCIDCYYVKNNGEEFKLLHDYNNNTNDFISDFKDKKYINLNGKNKLVEDNIDIYIDSQHI